ncbi:FAD-dependent monooxygenase [Kutzneria albida]|uniref:Putative aromatic compound monooxygenase yhjG n=1 Tax=Kutzneria albida DSM 43870 TaxID=1449976 RepID=W5VZD0_9PSEU|nr:FAD-dependent monooxygenase [Kutzneria albida]AHH93830.1 putative aromatic compound monooxygenase yhjG [Kutzneria albida DSM 43870]
MIDVVVVGGGPTGMMLACELRLAGVRTVVLERLAEPSGQSRALGLHVRSVEVLAQRGLLDRFVESSPRRGLGGHFAGVFKLRYDLLDTAHPFALGTPQATTERLLTERALELGAEIRRGSAVTGLSQDEQGVTVELADGQQLRASYVVGCDGGRSTVRGLLGVDFPGTPSQMDMVLADVELTESPGEAPFGIRPNGVLGCFHLGDGLYRVTVNAAEVAADRSVPPTLAEIKQRLREVAGTDFGAHSPRWISRFGNASRQARRYRVGRVLLAGDAAHIHLPAGGQGLNLGLQDAFNLGWKLAAQVNGWAPEGLLDTYHSERHPVGARVLENTRVQGQLMRSESLRDFLSELLDQEDTCRYLTGMISAVDIRYEVGEGAHPLLGKRMRDVGLKSGRLYDLLRTGRGLLLDQTGRGLSVPGWADRVDVVAECGEELDAGAVLLRPDGHVVWVDGGPRDLEAVLRQWFGAPATLRR